MTPVASAGVRRAAYGSDKMPGLFRVLQEVHDLLAFCQLTEIELYQRLACTLAQGAALHACMGPYRFYLRSGGCSRQKQVPTVAMHKEPACSAKVHAERLPRHAVSIPVRRSDWDLAPRSSSSPLGSSPQSPARQSQGLPVTLSPCHACCLCCHAVAVRVGFALMAAGGVHCHLSGALWPGFPHCLVETPDPPSTHFSTLSRSGTNIHMGSPLFSATLPVARNSRQASPRLLSPACMLPERPAIALKYPPPTLPLWTSQCRSLQFYFC